MMRKEVDELRNRWHGERRIESKEFRKRVALEDKEYMENQSGLTEEQKTDLCIDLMNDREGIVHDGYYQLKLLGLVPDKVDRLLKITEGRVYLNSVDGFKLRHGDE